MKRIQLFLAWYDCWVGIYFSQLDPGVVFVCLLPCVVLKLDFRKEQ